MSLNSSYQNLADMGLFDLIDLCVDYKELMDEENEKARKEAAKYR